MTEKHFYAGNNTAKGFFSYFGDVFKPEEAKRIYILKGGPGVGKSTFMKKIGVKMMEKGYSTEFVHCSSDDDSLDGIIIPDLGIAFVDGTAPHTMDPVLPGTADEIINLGVYIDSQKIEKNKAEIIEINRSISRLYASAFRFLECSGLIIEEINSIYNRYTNEIEYTKLSKEILYKIFVDSEQVKDKADIESVNNIGKIRHLFSEAYTSDGYINHTNSLCQGKKVWAVIGENSDYVSKLLDSIATAAINKGYDIEGYYRPLHPQKLQHLLIPELNIILVSSDNPNGNYDEVINLNKLLDINKLSAYNAELLNNKLLLEMLTKNALERLSNAKKMHDKLEIYYKSNVDFKGVDDCFDDIISRY